jgi:hypothetical protein
MTNHPSPEVQSRPAATSEMPRNALSLATMATASGWEVSATYARGSVRVGASRVLQYKVVDSIALRLRRDGERLVALWYDGQFSCGLLPHQRLNLSELKARITADVTVVAA